MLLTGFLKFDREIICSEDALGESFQAKVGEVAVTVSFPCLNIDRAENPLNCTGISNPLVAPPIAAKWKQGGHVLEWGYPISYPVISAAVYMVVITIMCEEREKRAVADAVYSDIKRWRDAFIDYCITVTAQSAWKNLSIINNDIDFRLYDTDYIPSGHATEICVHLRNDDDTITKEIINSACEFASSGKELLLEYQLMLKAYDAVREDRNRQAVIEACSALEICLDRVIQRYCAEKEISADKLLNKYRYLSSKTKAMEELYPGNKFPVNTKTRIIDIRNNVAHSHEGKMYPTDKETNELIICVQEWLSLFYSGYYSEGKE